MSVLCASLTTRSTPADTAAEVPPVWWELGVKVSTEGWYTGPLSQTGAATGNGVINPLPQFKHMNWPQIITVCWFAWVLAYSLAKDVRFSLPLPDRNGEEFKKRRDRYSNVRTMTPEWGQERYEQACRSKWRALHLSIKAKLVACQEGVETFEESFLAHFVVPGGRTIGEQVIPQLNEMASTGKIPALQLMAGGDA